MTKIAIPTPLEIERLSELDGKRYELHQGQLVDKTVAMGAPVAPTPLEVALPSKDDERLYELKLGQLVEKKTSMLSNAVAAEIVCALRTVYSNTKAHLFVKQPSWCFNDPNEMRRPDVALLWTNRFPDGLNDSELQLAPDLVVEVVSPTNTFGSVDERIAEFLDAGVPLIWVVNPTRRHVFVHRRDGSVAKYRQSDTIMDEPLLPGLAVAVAAFFPHVPAAT